MRKPRNINASVTSCTIGQSQHQSKNAEKKLLKCYLVTLPIFKLKPPMKYYVGLNLWFKYFGKIKFFGNFLMFFGNIERLLVTLFTYSGFSKEKFAYLSLLFKQKGYDNA
jgi:hypothetical protein